MLGKGPERLVARRLAWTAVREKIIHPQYIAALPGRSAVDLDSLIDGEVLGKRKLRTMQLDANESIIVDNRVEIFCGCDTLNQLRHSRWLNNWMLTAGIQISDKPYYVRYDESVDLDERDSSGVRVGGGTKLKVTRIHFCPLNIKTKSFYPPRNK